MYRYIGKTGLRVSPICLGTMTFCTQCASEQEAFAIMDKAYDSGVNFFDTAEVYPIPASKELIGQTEEIIGRWLKTKPRDSIILATKVVGAANGWWIPPVRHGLTAIDRFHIKTAIEGSLKRLGTDYIDLYQMHWPDTIVPIEESLIAFDELVREGKVRYIGTSNDTAYGLTKANETSKRLHIARFESIQNNFSVLNPRFFDELAHVCEKEQISLLPYSPLAGGVLSGKYNQANPPKEARFSTYFAHENIRQRQMAERFAGKRPLRATQIFLGIAQKYNIKPVTLAVMWSKHFSFVASTIIGATKLEQLDDSLMAMDKNLSEEVVQEIRAIYDEVPYPMG